MSCQRVRDFLIDDAAPRPLELQAHLATCADCRALEVGHRSALALRGVQLPSTRAALEPLRRRLSVMGGLALVAALGGWGWLRARPVVVTAPPTIEAYESPTDDWRALRQLTRATQAPSRTRPVTHDASYASFGRLPVWLAPRTTQPLRALGRAVSPLVQRSEELP